MRLIVFGILLFAAVVAADLPSDVSDIIKELPPIESDNVEPSSRSSDQSQNVELLKKFLQAPELKDIISYLKKRDVDIESVLLNAIVSPQLHNTKLNIAGWTIEGIFKHIIKVMSSPRFAGIIKQKMDADTEFARFVTAVQEPEFKELVYRAMNSNASKVGKTSEDNKKDASLWQRIKWSFHWGK